MAGKECDGGKWEAVNNDGMKMRRQHARWRKHHEALLPTPFLFLLLPTGL